MKGRELVLADRLASLADVPLSRETAVEHDVGRSMLAAVKAALLDGETHYTVRPGIPELRRQIALEIERQGGPAPDAEAQENNVLITSRESEAVFVILLSLGLDAGHVLVSSDDSFVALFRLMGLRVRKASPGDDTRLVTRHWSSDPSVQASLVAIAAERDLPDVLDLGPSLWTGSLDRFPPVDPARTLVIGNLDALPGLSTFRVAYLMGPKTFLARCRPWKQVLSICNAAPSQRAALHALAALRREAP